MASDFLNKKNIMMPFLIFYLFMKRINIYYRKSKKNVFFFIGNIFLNYPNFSPSKAKKYFSILIKDHPQGYFFDRAVKKLIILTINFIDEQKENPYSILIIIKEKQ